MCAVSVNAGNPAMANLSSSFIAVDTWMYAKMCKIYRSCLVSALNNCGFVTPYSDIELEQHWVRLWLVAWRHQAITWTNIDLSSVKSCALHLRALPYCYMIKITKTDYAMAKLLSYNCRYLDDICTINLKYFGDIAKDTYDSTLFLEGSVCSYKQYTLDLCCGFVCVA